MIKNYFVALFFLAGIISIASAQDVIVDGGMDNADAWLTSSLNTDADNTVEFEFSHIANGPIEGTGGCLHIVGTNTGNAGGNLTNFMFYQQVTLERGVDYYFDGAYKDIRSDNFWTEVYVGGNEPAEGSEYGTDQGAVLVSGFKSTNWESACPSDEFDGTFANDACTAGTTNKVYFEGTGDTTVFFGFRSGIWEDQGLGLGFEVFIDNISLSPWEASAVENRISFTEVFPNPFNDQLTISSVNQIVEVDIINMLGQSIYHRMDINENSLVINLSSRTPGIYGIRVKDAKGHISFTKSIKQ